MGPRCWARAGLRARAWAGAKARLGLKPSLGIGLLVGQGPWLRLGLRARLFLLGTQKMQVRLDIKTSTCHTCPLESWCLKTHFQIKRRLLIINLVFLDFLQSLQSLQHIPLLNFPPQPPFQHVAHTLSSKTIQAFPFGHSGRQSVTSPTNGHATLNLHSTT